MISALEHRTTSLWDEEDGNEDDDAIFILTTISIYQTCQEISRQLSDSKTKTKNNIANHLSMNRFKFSVAMEFWLCFFLSQSEVESIK